jgi:hypothetical protein
VRSASSRTASATWRTDTTIDPASTDRASGQSWSSTVLPPMPSMNVGVYATCTGLPAASDAAKGAAVSTSQA